MNLDFTKMGDLASQLPEIFQEFSADVRVFNQFLVKLSVAVTELDVDDNY